MIGSAATVLYGCNVLCRHTVAHGHKMLCRDGTDKDVTNIPEKHPSSRARSAVLERAGCAVPILGQPCPQLQEVSADSVRVSAPCYMEPYNTINAAVSKSPLSKAWIPVLNLSALELLLFEFY